MTQGGSVSWNKIILVLSAFGIPSLSILFWLVVCGTKLVDKVDLIQTNQVQQREDFKDLSRMVTYISRRVDTIAQAQHDNQKDIQHQLELQDIKYSPRRNTSNVIEKYVDGKLTFLPSR